MHVPSHEWGEFGKWLACNSRPICCSTEHEQVVCRLDDMSIACLQWYTDILVPCMAMLGLVCIAKCGTWFGLANTPMYNARHMFMCSPGLVCTWAQCTRLRTCVVINYQPCIGRGAGFSMSGTTGDCLQHCGHIGDKGHAIALWCFVWYVFSSCVGFGLRPNSEHRE